MDRLLTVASPFSCTLPMRSFLVHALFSCVLVPHVQLQCCGVCCAHPIGFLCFWLIGVPFNDAYGYMDRLLTVPVLSIEILLVMEQQKRIVGLCRICFEPEKFILSHRWSSAKSLCQNEMFGSWAGLSQNWTRIIKSINMQISILWWSVQILIAPIGVILDVKFPVKTEPWWTQVVKDH